jgi:threonine synthase
MNHLSTLKCVTCGREYPPGENDTTCGDCGPLLGTLEVIYDYDAASQELTHSGLAANRRYDMWRYLPLLPVRHAESIPHLNVGWTPVYRSERLATQMGIRAVWVKDDGRNPTASLKDRASAVAAADAVEKGVKTVTAASTGNAAASWSAFTAIAGLKTVIFVPESAPPAKLAQLLIYGATVIQVRGTYDQAFDLSCQAAEKWNWYNRSTAVNPFLGEGKKTAAFELCEQSGWDPPEYVFVGVGDGCIFQGLWKGFKEFFTMGLIKQPPRLIGVQAEGAAPLVKAWDARADRADSMAVSTVADSIAVGTPRDQIKCLKSAKESGGGLIAVRDEQILAAIRRLAATSGVMAEPAGAVALAGALQMAAEGRLKPRDRVAVMITGNGLKDIASVRSAAEATPISVAPSLEEVAHILNAATG